MKKPRLPLFLTLLIAGSLVLAGCTGSTAINAYPGLSATPKSLFLADKGYVYFIDASNGTMTCRFPDKAATSTPFYAPPAVSDNLIVAGNYGHMLYGIDTSCKQKWVFDSRDGYFVGGPLIVNDTVLAPSSNNNLYAINTADGKVRWKFTSKNALWATPASDGKVVYVPALDHMLTALNLSDGKIIWSKDLGYALISSPVLSKDGSTLYLGDMGGNVTAIKTADGSVQWKAKPGGQIWSSPALNNDTVFVGNSNGKVFAISTKNGATTWSKDAGGAILAGGALLDNAVVFTTESGAVVAYSLDGQKEVWRQTINGKLYTTPVVTGQTLVVAVTQGDNLLQTFNQNGQLTWPFVAPK